MSRTSRKPDSSTSKQKYTKQNMSDSLSDLNEYSISFGGVDRLVLKSFENDLLHSVEKSETEPKRRSQKSNTSSRKKDESQESVSQSRSERVKDFSSSKKETSEKGKNAVYMDPVVNVMPKSDDFLDLSSKSKKSSRTQSQTVTSTNRDLRSKHKYGKVLGIGQSKRIFSIEVFIHLYNENPSYYEQKLDTILSDFSVPTENCVEENDHLNYVYLLLDPRKFSDIRTIGWVDFIKSIFYICKGKNKKPLKHIQEAEKYWLSGTQCAEARVRRIHDIWRTKKPVMILTIFENVDAEDAYTREASMIDAIGMHRLCRNISGAYYGTAATLTVREKHELGATLLVKARQNLMRRGAKRVYPKAWNLSGIAKDEVKNSDVYDYDWLHF